MMKIWVPFAFFLLIIGCAGNPQKKALAAKMEHQALQTQLLRVSHLDSVVCKTMAEFKLPACFLDPDLKPLLNTGITANIEKCSSCKTADSLFLSGKEYYSLNIELRKPAHSALALFIGYTFVSAAADTHGLGIIYDLEKQKDSLYINHESVPKQWMK